MSSLSRIRRFLDRIAFDMRVVGQELEVDDYAAWLVAEIHWLDIHPPDRWWWQLHALNRAAFVLTRDGAPLDEISAAWQAASAEGTRVTERLRGGGR